MPRMNTQFKIAIDDTSTPSNLEELDGQELCDNICNARKPQQYICFGMPYCRLSKAHAAYDELSN